MASRGCGRWVRCVWQEECPNRYMFQVRPWDGFLRRMGDAATVGFVLGTHFIAPLAPFSTLFSLFSCFLLFNRFFCPSSVSYFVFWPPRAIHKHWGLLKKTFVGDECSSSQVPTVGLSALGCLRAAKLRMWLLGAVCVTNRVPQSAHVPSAARG